MSNERMQDLLFGLNVIGWGVAGLWSSDVVDRWTTVRVCIAALHFSVGGLLVWRAPLRRGPSTLQLVSALPSLVCCGVAFKATAAPHAWPMHAACLFLLATIWSIVALWSLGKNFSIFPALRQITEFGPYQLVRHPAYAGELFMVGSCALARPTIVTILALVVLLPMLALRIDREEQLLHAEPAYVRYSDRTPWKLFPGLW